MRLGAFVRGPRIGFGGMGDVYAATHHDSGLSAAIKVVRSARRSSQKSLRRFHQEARAMARLDHPSVVRVYDVGWTSEGPWIAMERCDGGLPIPQDDPRLRDVLRQVLHGLAHAHARGVVHRDIKTGNLLTRGDDVVLADFGLAWSLDDPDISIAGTPSNMPPEQFMGRNIGPWTDLYALACTAWRWVTGHQVFPGTDPRILQRAHARAPLPHLVPRFPVSPGLEAWLHRLLQKRVAARFVTASDALAALNQLAPAQQAAGRPARWDTEDTPSIPVDELDTGVLPEPDDLARRTMPALPQDVAKRAPLDHPPADTGLGLVSLRPPPYVGRGALRRQLWQRVLDTRHGPRCVLLTGPAGVGKSRLAHWVGERAAESGGLFGVARHSPMQTTGAAEMLARLVGYPDRDALRDGLRRSARSEASLLLGILEGQVPPNQRNQGLTQLLTRVCRRGLDQGLRPAVLLFDDVQWGAESLFFVRHLVTTSLPVLVVLTTRDGEGTELAHVQLRRLAPESHALGPLGDTERRAMVSSMLGLRGALADEVQALTQGNPLFAVEVVRELARRGDLVPHAGGHRLKDGARIVLPETLLGAVSESVQPFAGRDDVGLAAALGTRVLWSEWEAVGGGEQAAAEALVQAGLVDEDPEGFTFRHPTLPEALLRLHPQADRLHRACAAALQDPERVARHFLAAGDGERALPHLLEAADQARRRAYWVRSRDLADRARAVLEGLGSDPSDLHWQMADLVDLTRRVQREGGTGREAFEALRERSTHPWVIAWTWSRQGEMNRHRANTQLARHQFLQALPLHRANNDRRGVELTLAGLADCHRQLGQGTQAQAVYQDLLQTDDPQMRAHANRGLCTLARQRGQLDRAEQFARKALAIEEAHHMLPNRHHTVNELAEIARERGDLEEAEALYTQAQEMLLLVGGPSVYPRLNRVLVWLEQDRHGPAGPEVERLLQECQDQGYDALLLGLHLCAAECAALAGHTLDVDHHLDHAEARLALQHGELDPDDVRVAARLATRCTGPRAARARAIACFTQASRPG